MPSFGAGDTLGGGAVRAARRRSRRSCSRTARKASPPLRGPCQRSAVRLASGAPRAAPVAHHHGHAGMGRQPRRRPVGAAVRQQVDDAPAFEVARDRAVAVAPAPCPAVRPEHPHRKNRGGGAGADAAQQGGATDRHAHGRGLTAAGIAAGRRADAPVHGAQPFRLAGARPSDAGQRFGERSSRANELGTAQAPDANQQDGRAAEARRITRAAPAGAMNAARNRSASRARRCCRRRMDAQGEAPKALADLLQEPKAGEKADRSQRNVQGRYRGGACFPPYGRLTPRKGRTHARLYGVGTSTCPRSHKTSKNPNGRASSCRVFAHRFMMDGGEGRSSTGAPNHARTNPCCCSRPQRR